MSAAGWARLGLRAAGLALLLALVLPFHLLLKLIGTGSPFPRVYLAIGARICGARVRVRGTPLKRDVFFISNHVSWIDIMAIAGASGTAFVAKAEIGAAPAEARVGGAAHDHVQIAGRQARILGGQPLARYPQGRPLLDTRQPP